MGSEVIVPQGNIIDQILVYIGNYTLGLLDRINNMMGPLLGRIADYANQVEYVIGQSLNGVVTQISYALNSLGNSVSHALDSVFQGMQASLSRLWSGIDQMMSGVLNSISGLVSQAWSNLQSFANSVINNVAGLMAGAYNALSNIAARALDAIGQVASDIGQKVLGLLARAFDDTDRALAQQVSTIDTAIKRVLGASDSLISTVAQRVGDLATAFRDTVRPIAEKLGDVAANPINELRKSLEGLLKPLSGVLEPEASQQLTSAVEGLLGSHTLALQGRDDVQAIFQRLMPENALARTIWTFLFAFVIGFNVFRGVLDANAQVVLQEFAKTYPYNMLDEATAIAAWRRAIMPDAVLDDNLKRHGYSDADINYLKFGTFTPPPPADAAELWLRGFVDEKALDTALRAAGLESPWLEAAKRAAMIVPPVQDIITMAVREAFTPAIAERFGQYDDYPEALTTYAKQKGLSEEWAKRYWAAHWALPSVQMGFEMLHRRKPGSRESVIGPEDLSLLLRAQDVMPFWRDKLIDIAYTPYTRVDIRRMHQLGLLTEEQVYDAHLDLGYDPEKAQNLTAFVVRLNKGTPSEDEQDLGKLSRATVLAFYKDGVITKDKAIALLVGMNYTAEAAALYVQSVQLDVQRAERQAQADHVIDLATAGQLTFAAAQDKLNQLGLTSIEVDTALTKLTRAEEKKVKLPTRGEGESFFLKGVITESDYRDLLSRLGYAVKWIDAYVRFAKGKTNAH